MASTSAPGSPGKHHTAASLNVFCIYPAYVSCCCKPPKYLEALLECLRFRTGCCVLCIAGDDSA